MELVVDGKAEEGDEHEMCCITIGIAGAICAVA